VTLSPNQYIVEIPASPAFPERVYGNTAVSSRKGFGTRQQTKRRALQPLSCRMKTFSISSPQWTIFATCFEANDRSARFLATVVRAALTHKQR
jgi:hypothetical protein